MSLCTPRCASASCGTRPGSSLKGADNRANTEHKTPKPSLFYWRIKESPLTLEGLFRLCQLITFAKKSAKKDFRESEGGARRFDPSGRSHRRQLLVRSFFRAAFHGLQTRFLACCVCWPLEVCYLSVMLACLWF